MEREDKSMSKEFKKGDRVKLLQNVDYAKKGMIGTYMVDYSEDESGYKFIPVEFDDKFEGGHGCAGLTNPDRGHYIDPNVLKKIEPSHAFTLVITSKGDHTDAKLIHGKHTDKWVWVDRYKEDEYSEVAAIHAVIDKMFPAGAPVPAEEKPKRFTGKAVFNGADRYFTQGNVYTFEDGSTMDDDSDERGVLLTYDDWKYWFEENFVVINNPEEL